MKINSEIAIILGSSKDSNLIFKIYEELKEIVPKYKNLTVFDFDDMFEEDNYYDFDDHFNHYVLHIIENYDLLLFITPVHSYYISNSIEDFLRQMTYVLELERKNRRLPRNKYVAAISSSSDKFIGDRFFSPFKEFCEINNLEYVGDVSINSYDIPRKKIKKMFKSIENYLNKFPESQEE